MSRPVLRWMLVLVLCGTAGGGAYVYHLLNHCDELLRQALLTKLNEIAPNWDVEVGACRFNLRGEVVVDDITLRVGDERATLVEVPQAVVVLDRDRFVDKQMVVQQVRLTRPQVWLARDPGGAWNVLKLPPRPKSGSQVAEWRIEQATVHVQLDDPQGGNPATLVLRNAEAELVPSGKRRLLIKASGGIDLAERFAAHGEWDLEDASWDGALTLQHLKVGTEVVSLAMIASPAARGAVEKLQAATTKILEERRLAMAGDAVIPAAADSVADPVGLAGLMNVTLHLAQPPQSNLTWRAAAEVLEGEVSNVLLPFTLYNLKGKLEADAGKVTFKEFTARNGATAADLSGEVTLAAVSPEGGLTVTIRDLPFDPRVRGCLCGPLGRIYDALNIHGRCDVDLRLAAQPDGGWSPSGTMAVKDAQVTHTSFPLTAEAVNGTITLAGREMAFQMTGRASRRPITLTGKVVNPGPTCSAVFDIHGMGMPLDDRFRGACTPRVQAIFDHLRLQGEFDGHVKLIRPPGLRQRYTPYIVARLKNGSIKPNSFPYLVTGLTARVEGSGLRWKVTEAVGKHEQAIVRASGRTEPTQDGLCGVDLEIEALGAALDTQLQAALEPRWQALWAEFAPSGHINANAHVFFIEKQRPDVDLDVSFIDAAMKLQSFPYALESVQATAVLKDGRLSLNSFTGRHEDMRLTMTGAGDFTVPGEWVMRLEDIVVDDLSPDNRFRKALPEKLRQVVETLDPRGRLSLSGMMELAGTDRPDDPVTAAWDLEFINSGTTITAGIDLNDLFGKLRLWGTWDGQDVQADGRVELDSLMFRGLQLTKVRGPLSVNGTQLVIGSKDALNVENAMEGTPPVDNSERLTADFIDGTLGLDGVVKLSEQTAYRVKVTLGGGRLERYAELYLPGHHKVMGVMNGWLDLSGKGTSAKSLSGRGKLVISPASLYEVPIIMAIFNILKFVPPDKTAFRTAEFQFKVENSKYFFERIQLVGDAISLAGKGIVGFDGNVSLDFYSRGGRAKFPLPFVSLLVDEATKGWVRVIVRGTINRPTAVIQAMPQMDDALRGLLGILAGPPPAMRR